MTDLLEAAESGPQSVGYQSVKEQAFVFDDGLLGFPQYKRYQLERFRPANGAETPFFVLRCLEDELSFPVIHPAALGIDYRLPISRDLMNALNANCADALTVVLIVTVRDRVEDTTINLQGPLVLNTLTGLGLQLVIEQYPLRHPMLVQIEY